MNNPTTPNPGAQALGIAAAHLIDRHTIPNDVTYLVRNGINPHDAALRVIEHRRRMTVWGFVAAPSLLWIGVLLGWGLLLSLPGAARIVLTGSVNPLPVVGGIACSAAALGWAYLLALYALHSWRRAARGCEFEDSRSPWFPARRPPSGPGAAVVRPDNRATARLVAAPLLLVAASVLLAPILGGLAAALDQVLKLL